VNNIGTKKGSIMK